MKILVIFYSRTKTTKILAEAIAKKLSADIEEVFDTVDRSGAWGYVKSGRDAFMKKTTVIKELLKNPAEYDIVVIGTPVWAGTMAPAIRTYITMNKNKIKESAFFCTQAALKEQGLFNKLREIISKREIASLSLTTKEVINGKFDDKLVEFINSITESEK